MVMAALAIVVILLAVRALGARDEPRYRSPAEVRALIGDEHPELTVGPVVLAADGRAALAVVDGGPSVAVALVVGNQLTSRPLHAGELAGLDVRVGAGDPEVVLRTHDVGLPAVTLRMPTGAWREWEPRLRALVGAILLLAGLEVGAQSPGCAAALAIRVVPPTPKPGTFYRLQVEGAPTGAVLSGDAHGEALHFHETNGVHVALAGVPIDTSGTSAARVRCGSGAVEDTVLVRVPLGAARYPTEALRVDPRYATRPDSVLARRIARESAQANEVARASHDTPRLWDGAFARPRPSRVTSGFGRGRAFNGTLQSRHMGTDFAGTIGAPVRAIQRGVVRIVDEFYYGGRVVYLDHGAGLTSAYLHLSRHRVAVGDTVERGTVVGNVGATGRVTGPHLHLITRYGVSSLDPLSLLPAAAGASR